MYVPDRSKMVELDQVIAESRALRAELRHHSRVRKGLARDFCSLLNEARGLSVDDVRILQMNSLLLDAYRIALSDENGLTVDLIADALSHLNERLEREILPHFD